ncbi:MAG: choice-of-anchor A family protein, partial [Lachnospiraceae bacterium]|nr:choice-of-anchor A family protein [Lachnospiraceae bacterium]
MKGRKRQTIRCYIAGILVGALVIGMTVCLQGQVKAGYDTGDWVYTYPSTDPLYAATHFHMFAQDSIINSTHAHGNVATKSLDSGVDFGTRTSYYPSGKSTEISYARDLVNLNANAVAGTFVLGSDWKITSDKNAGQTTITNGKKSFTLNAIKYDNILIEKEGKYVIDIDTEFSKLKSISSYWARQSSSSTVNVDIAGDQNARVIDFANTKMTSGVVTKSISYADWTKYGNSITLKNLDTDTSHTGIVVLNIDLKGVSTANMTVNDMNLSPKSPGMANATTKTETSGGEVGSDQYGTVRVVYNLYDSSKSDYVFAGKISWDHRVFGSILAPGATITFGAVNGTIVGKKLIHSGGESHRRDLIGESGSGITEANPTPTPTKKPTATPTKAPTATPTKAPTATPTKAPTATPTKAPTATPTKAPTASPTKAPTATPTKTPAATPTKAPAAT